MLKKLSLFFYSPIGFFGEFSATFEVLLLGTVSCALIFVAIGLNGASSAIPLMLCLVLLMGSVHKAKNV